MGRHAPLAAACVLVLTLAAGPAVAQVLVIGPTQAQSCYNAARTGAVSETAIDGCTQSLRTDALTLRDRAATNVNRGILRMAARDHAGALADYDEATRLQPQMAEAYVNRGIALLQLGNAPEEAARSLTNGIDRQTARPELAYYMRGVAHEMLGDTRKAYFDYRQAASLKPDWEDPRTELGRFTVVRK